MLKRRYLFIIISGVLFSIPFFLPELNILSFFSCIPFFIILFDEIKNSRKNKAIKYTVVFGMSFYLPVFLWFFWMYPMEQTGLTPLQSAFIVTAAWLGFPVLQTFVMIILPFGLKLFRNIYTRENDKNTKNDKNDKINIFFLPLLTAFLYVTTEWVQSWFMSGLTWAKLSVSQYKDLFFIQSTSLFGTYFSGFVIIFINASIAIHISSKSYKTIPANKNNLLILAAVLLYFANSYFGFFRVMYYDHTERAGERQKITAQIVQGNISSYEKWEISGIDNSFRVYETLMEENCGENIDICVFPETAIPAIIIANTNGISRLYNMIHDLAKKHDVTLFTGAIFCDYGDYNDFETAKRYNAIMAFDKDHDFIKPYGKRHLVPFGEYLPLENVITKVFPFVSNMTLFDTVLTVGEDAGIMDINGVNYGGLVCFDSIFPELARNSVKSGADILIIATNDSWFRDSPAIYHHNAQAALRAVENNRYVIRSANTGVSSFISNTGKIIQQSNVLEREVLTQDVEIVKNKTVYTVCGDVILYLSWVYILFCVVWLVKIKIKINRPETITET